MDVLEMGREPKLEAYDGWKILYSNMLSLTVHNFYTSAISQRNA